jgi:hypothetical protein
LDDSLEPNGLLKDAMGGRAFAGPTTISLAPTPSAAAMDAAADRRRTLRRLVVVVVVVV